MNDSDSVLRFRVVPKEVRDEMKQARDRGYSYVADLLRELIGVTDELSEQVIFLFGTDASKMTLLRAYELSQQLRTPEYVDVREAMDRLIASLQSAQPGLMKIEMPHSSAFAEKLQNVWTSARDLWDFILRVSDE
jgi:hypothetical protein